MRLTRPMILQCLNASASMWRHHIDLEKFGMINYVICCATRYRQDLLQHDRAMTRDHWSNIPASHVCQALEKIIIRAAKQECAITAQDPPHLHILKHQNVPCVACTYPINSLHWKLDYFVHNQVSMHVCRRRLPHKAWSSARITLRKGQRGGEWGVCVPGGVGECRKELVSRRKRGTLERAPLSSHRRSFRRIPHTSIDLPMSVSALWLAHTSQDYHTYVWRWVDMSWKNMSHGALRRYPADLQIATIGRKGV